VNAAAGSEGSSGRGREGGGEGAAAVDGNVVASRRIILALASSVFTCGRLAAAGGGGFSARFGQSRADAFESGGKHVGAGPSAMLFSVAAAAFVVAKEAPSIAMTRQGGATS
jgi:hypothetical protein